MQWGGEAPEWRDFFRGGPDRSPRLDVATPPIPPSRGLTLDPPLGARFVLTKRTRTRKFAALRSRSVIRESRPPSDERELIPTVVSLLTPVWRALLAVPERFFEEPGMALTKSLQGPAR